MDQSPFSRAKRFLNFYPTMKWVSLLASIATGFLYVLLLVPLALFVELIVTRGDIPAFHHLPETQQPSAHNQQDLTDQELWAARLQGTAAAKNDMAKVASVMSLPVELQTEESQKLRAEVEKTWTGQWRNRLEQLGIGTDTVSQEELDSVINIAADVGPSDEATVGMHTAYRNELEWRWFVHQYLLENVSESAAELYRSRITDSIKEIGLPLTLDRDVTDLGVLSLVVRMRDRIDGPVLAWLASFNTWMWKDGFNTYLIGILISAVILGVIRAGVMFLSNYPAALAAGEAATRLRRAIYHHTYRLGTLAFRALGPTEAVGVSTRHLEAVHDSLIVHLTVSYREPVKFVLLVVLACFINFWLAMAFLMSALLVWMIGGQVAAYFRSKGRAYNQRAAEQLALIQESIMLMRLAKAYLMELFNQARVERQLSKYYNAQVKQALGEAIYRPVLVLFGLLAFLMLALVVGLNVVNGKLGISGAVIMVTALVSMYLPLQVWLQNRRVLRRGYDSATTVFQFLDRRGSLSQNLDAEFLPPLSKNLEFDNVTFKEPGGGRKLLEDVSFTVKAGERVAFVGPEDLQKHALVYLIARFLDPTSGEIRLDRQNLRLATLDSLRAQLGMVLQHNLVFNDTVANNIGCGDNSYTLPQIIEAAKKAHAHQFIQNLPRGYETRIGDLGHRLDVGEQFRIALARAILRDPALLIIEEPDTPLPEDVKDLLDDTMARVLPGRTVIFLPHRLSTIRHCDKVFLLYERKIVASGEHKELLNNNDLYRHLQYLEFNEFTGYSGKSSNFRV